MSDYCQIPTYAYQSVLPSVSFLISNSKSMLQFAYGDANPANLCTDSANPCGGFNSSTQYYGYFDNNSWYEYTSTGGNGFIKRDSKAATPSKGSNPWWDGNFLNWLTLRRIDVVRQVITGGEGAGYAACPGGLYKYKKFPVGSASYTPYNVDNVLVTFNDQSDVTETACRPFRSTSSREIVNGNPTIATITFNVQEKGAARSGIYQVYAGKAQMEFFFYNTDNEGAATKIGINGTQPPTSVMLSLINTPSNYNGIANAPLGEALWTIVGHYALSTSSSGAGYGNCSSCGPKYHNNDYSTGDDPYTFYGSPSQCVKGNVIVISDGEPCDDGNLPSGIVTFGDNNSAFLTKCTGNGCGDASTLGIPYKPAIPACTTAGGNVAGFERVALFAHTQDLRQLNNFNGIALGGTQNLDIYAIRAFGSDNSNILKYGAINRTFSDLNGNGVPDSGEFDTNSAYFLANNGAAIKNALDSIFFNVLKRATSGTATSILPPATGSGAKISSRRCSTPKGISPVM